MVDVEQEQRARRATWVGALGLLLLLWGGFAATVHGSTPGTLVALLGIGLLVVGVFARLRA